MAGDDGTAEIERSRRVDIESDIKPIGGKSRSGAIRPFDQDQSVVGRFLPTQLDQLVGRFDAIEIGMDDGKFRPIIDLHQGEGRARHFGALILDELAHQRARERAFAGAKIARQGDDIIGPNEFGDIARQRGGFALAGQINMPDNRFDRLGHYDAFATRPLLCRAGKKQVTTVPSPGTDSI